MPFFKELGKLFKGQPGKYEYRNTLGPDQQSLYQQMLQSLQQQGAGGAFGSAADYYRDLLSDDSKTFDAFAAPEMRRFNEEIVPGLSEQFAGMGSGALSSSGFRNAAVNAGTDLSERLGAIRAQLRQQGAQGLNQMGQFGLGQFGQTTYTPAKGGLLDFAGPALGAAATAIGGPVAGALGQAAGNWVGSKFGKSNPYGNQGA